MKAGRRGRLGAGATTVPASEEAAGDGDAGAESRTIREETLNVGGGRMRESGDRVALPFQAWTSWTFPEK